ncbi:MAG: AAA family ATPase [Metamycoplasmataceae bacterium]
MDFSSIKIRNFKSIRDEITIDLKENFNFMLGLNGVGKSNIIEAINFINEKDKSIKYKNYSHHDDIDDSNDISISYYLNNFTNSDINELNNIIKEPFIQRGFLGMEILPRIGEIFKEYIDEITFKIVKFLDCGIFFVNFSLSKKNEKVISLKTLNSEKILPLRGIFKNFHARILKEINNYFDLIFENLKKRESELHYPNPEERELHEETKVTILSKLDELIGEKSLYLTDFEILLDISKIFKIKKWKYDNKYILDNVIQLDSFSMDPLSVSIPLFNILVNCDIDPKSIYEKSKSSTERPKISSNLNKLVNQMFESNWPDFKKSNLELQFYLNEGKMDINIKNKDCDNFKPLSGESDGYKQYISMLCTFGIEKMENTLLTIDEPETHLHPSSILSIREVLKKLSKEGVFIIGATHSIHMVDLKNLQSYFEVYKNDEYITKINRITELNDGHDFPKIIIQCFGTDIFSNHMFKKYSIVVEGESDLKIIEKILNDKNIDHILLNGYGAGNFPRILKALEDTLGKEYYEKNCFSILDGDDAGNKTKQKLISSNIINENKIIMISDIFNQDNELKTIEVFLDEESQKEFLKIKKNSKIEMQEFKLREYQIFERNMLTEGGSKNIEKFINYLKDKGIDNS